MVKIIKSPKNQAKQKKVAPPPPKEVEDSEEEESSEEEDSSEEEAVPQKKVVTPKAAAIPGKKVATPAKKAVATPAKKAVATPAKKAVPTPAKGAKNGKNAKKKVMEEEEEEEEEDDDSEEDEDDSEEEVAMPVKPSAKKSVPAKPVAVPAKQESDDEEEEDDDEEEDEEEDDSEDEAMDTTLAKGKKAAPVKAAPVKAKASSEDEEDDDDDDEDDDDDDEDDDEEEESMKEVPGKRKKEMPKQKNVPEAKKKRTEETASAFSLFMGNLNASKDYEELKTAIKEFFGKKNLPVLEVRIGGSKRFGYVDFSSAEDLDKSLEFNGKKFMGLEIKLERARSKETNKETKKERDARTLFVKNLPYRITQDELREVFEDALEIRLVAGKDGSSKGIAYIEFKTEAEADKALEEKQGTEIEGRSIILDYTGEKSQQETPKVGGESKTLIVNNLSYNATEESLQEVFEKASSIRMPQNVQGKPKGYAFVEFSTVEDAKEALNSCNNTEIEGRTIRLEFSAPGGQKGGGGFNARGGFNQQTKTLFVKGLSEDTTEETLRESFEGSVNARIVMDRDTGSSKGFGFVDFSCPEDAKAAKEAMEDGEIDGNKVTLDYAKPKGDGQRGGGFGGRGGGGRGGRGGFSGRGGRGGFGGRGGGFRGGRGGGEQKPQGKKIKFND